jgi:hypothetical protein
MTHRVSKNRTLKGQKGQALTEFLVVAIALVPLFLLIPVIAKYQDIAHSTQMASRYAAFDGMVRNASQNSVKPVDQLQDEVRRRFFSNSDSPVKTKDVAGDFKANQNLFWRTPDDQPLIEKFTDIVVTRTSHSSSDTKPFTLTFGSKGISTVNVSVKLANLPAGLQFYEPFDKINLEINRGTSVLVDGWTGKTPVDVEQKVSGIAPNFTVLSNLSPVVDPIMMLVEPGVTPPKLGRLDFWRDDVPLDRLKAQ